MIAETRTMLETIVVLGHGMGLEVVAEGIQSESQRDALRAMSCDYGQGYFISRPLAPDQFAFVADSSHQSVG